MNLRRTSLDGHSLLLITDFAIEMTLDSFTMLYLNIILYVGTRHAVSLQAQVCELFQFFKCKIRVNDNFEAAF
jgi:hypothetical protein